MQCVRSRVKQSLTSPAALQSCRTAPRANLRPSPLLLPLLPTSHWHSITCCSTEAHIDSCTVFFSPMSRTLFLWNAAEQIYGELSSHTKTCCCCILGCMNHHWGKFREISMCDISLGTWWTTFWFEARITTGGFFFSNWEMELNPLRVKVCI